MGYQKHTPNLFKMFKSFITLSLIFSVVLSTAAFSSSDNNSRVLQAKKISNSICTDPKFPFAAQKGSIRGKLCYSKLAYIKAGSGPCGSWCTMDIKQGSGCGNNAKRMCHGKKAKATTHWRYIGVNRRYKGGYAPWGGQCKCPNGQVLYAAEYRHTSCGRLQCHGGKKLNCNRKNGPWSNYRVVCTTRRVKVTVHKKVVHHKKVVVHKKKPAHKKIVHHKKTKKVVHKKHIKKVVKKQIKKALKKAKHAKKVVKALKKKIAAAKKSGKKPKAIKKLMKKIKHAKKLVKHQKEVAHKKSKKTTKKATVCQKAAKKEAK